MKKITLEFIRLGIVFFNFIYLMLLLFAYINQLNSEAFQILGELLTIPVMLISIIIPLWLITDLFKKQVIDKTIFNLTFFICSVNLFLFGFAFIYLD